MLKPQETRVQKGANLGTHEGNNYHDQDIDILCSHFHYMLIVEVQKKNRSKNILYLENGRLQGGGEGLSLL